MSDITPTQAVALPPMGEAFIDYLSLTKAAGNLYPWDTDQPGEGIRNALFWVGFPTPFVDTVMGGGWTEENGLHGFARAYVLAEGGVRLQVGHNSGRIHLVLSGRGCKLLTDCPASTDMDGWDCLWREGDAFKLTRLDIARDFDTDLYPVALRDYIGDQRKRTSGLITSDTGQTASFGSRSSDKYLRVYRYDPPHPRSETLRFEWEIKGKACVQAHRALIEGSTPDALMAGLMLDFLSGLPSPHPPTTPPHLCG